MQAFLERLEELDEDFSTLVLQGAQLVGAELRLRFELSGTTYENEEVAESWEVSAHSVTDHALRLGECWPALDPQSPRLRVAQVPWRRLTFAAPPRRTVDLLAELRAVHDERQWDRFGTYGLGGRVELGYGVFAEGPAPLLELYFPVLEAQGMRPGYFAEPLRPEPPEACLTLGGEPWQGDRYVLACHFSARRTGAARGADFPEHP